VSGESPGETGSPGRVTALQAQKGPRERLNVFVEGEYAFALDAWVARQAGLTVGEVLTEARRQDLLRQEERETARSRALRFLEVRERARGEVAARLRRYGYAGDLVEETLGWLEARGFVDDRRFAEVYVAEKRRAGWGVRRIEAELSRKGLGRDLIAEVMGEAAQEQDTAAAEGRLTTLLVRRFGAEATTDSRRAEQRARSFLLRRGHPWEDADRLVRTALRPPGETDDEDGGDDDRGRDPGGPTQ